MNEESAWLDYRVRWRSREVRPGRHGARQAGQGGTLRGFVPFWQAPDARRIDVRRSLLDAGGDLIVRQMESRGTIGVVLACDLSRSMQPREDEGRFASVARLCAALARSARRAGDAFGFIGFDETLRADLHLPLTRAQGPALLLAERLAGFCPDGAGAEGMALIGPALPERRCLLLLVSDFLAPIGLIERALAELAGHDVAPIVVRDPAEAKPPGRGLIRLRDAETGATRVLLMRRGTRARAAEAAAAHEQQLQAVFRRYCRPAFVMRGPLDLPALSQHLVH